MLKAVGIIAALALAGCATTTPIGTRSGNPELTLVNVRADCVKAGLVNAFIDSGMAIESASDYLIVAGKPTSNTMASLLFGTRMDATVEERYTATLAPQVNGNDLRIVVAGAYVSNPGTAFEKRQPMKAGGNIQQQFMAAKPVIESRCAKT